MVIFEHLGVDFQLQGVDLERFKRRASISAGRGFDIDTFLEHEEGKLVLNDKLITLKSVNNQKKYSSLGRIIRVHSILKTIPV